MKLLRVIFVIFFTPFLAQANSLKGCNPTQIRLLANAEKSVMLRLIEVEKQWPLISLLGAKRDFVTPDNRVWIEGNPNHVVYQTYWKEMGEVFHKMSLDASSGLNFECVPNSGVCNGSVEAYVKSFFNIPIKKIHVCPSFFRDTVKGQAETLMHELSHYSGNTEDFGSDWQLMEKSNLKHAARDAYHIQAFMFQDAATVMKRVIWPWWWPRKK